MGIRIKVLPGLYVGVNKRGMNASIGPRIARAHVGNGGIRYSSGLGPVTVSGGRRTKWPKKVFASTVMRETGSVLSIADKKAYPHLEVSKLLTLKNAEIAKLASATEGIIITKTDTDQELSKKRRSVGNAIFILIMSTPLWFLATWANQAQDSWKGNFWIFFGIGAIVLLNLLVDTYKRDVKYHLMATDDLQALRDELLAENYS